MKKIILFILIFLNISYFCYSQKDDRLNKAEAIQIAYLTKELGLTPQEAEKFWPVYNNYKNEIRSARTGNPSDVIGVEENVLNVRKKYKSEFLRVLPDANRVNKIFTADKNFRDMLSKELQNRKKDDFQKQNQRGKKN